MPGPMKMRATLGQGFTDIRVLMTHPMETGQRKDSEGKIVPMHFIQNLTVKVNGKPVIEAQTSQAISRNPVLDRKSTRLNSSHLVISYAVFCLKKKKNIYWSRLQ